MIKDAKMMVMIVWNRYGFHLIDALPKGSIFNAIYYVNIILQPLLDGRTSGPGPSLRIHADNTRPHTAGKILKFAWEDHLEIATNLPYSPDLAPSDFFLLGNVKRALEGAEFRSPEALLAAI
jgi:hypothetical protein